MQYSVDINGNNNRLRQYLTARKGTLNTDELKLLDHVERSMDENADDIDVTAALTAAANLASQLM